MSVWPFRAFSTMRSRVISSGLVVPYSSASAGPARRTRSDARRIIGELPFRRMGPRVARSRASVMQAMVVDRVRTAAASGPQRRAPGKAADLDGPDRLPVRHVDHGDVARDAIGGEELLARGVEGQVPDTAADEDVVFDLVGLGVHDGDVVRRTERHEGGPAVGGELEPHRLDLLIAHA